MVDVRLPMRCGRALAVPEGMGKYSKLAMRHADAEVMAVRRARVERIVKNLRSVAWWLKE